MRVVMIVAAGLLLTGCSSTSTSSFSDWFKTTPPEVELQLDSTPQGANAVTSLGPSCTTPCTVKIPAKDNFTVTYTLDKYEAQTVPVNVVSQSGGSIILDPNPATAELVATTPPKRKPARRRHVARKPAPAAAAPAPAAEPAPAAAPAQNSPFPPVH